MNRFDPIFFSKYVASGQQILMVAHRHVFSVIDDIIVILFFTGVLPLFFYHYNSFDIRALVSITDLIYWIVGIYFFLLYRIFDWYNDVWIFTQQGVYDLDWRLFSARVIFVEYSDVHGVELGRSGWIESLINRGTIQVHLANDDEWFILTQAWNPKEVVDFLQSRLSHGHHDHHDEEHDEWADRSESLPPYDALMNVLGEVVREHLDKRGYPDPYHKEAYENKLASALSNPRTIDLRPKPKITPPKHAHNDESDEETDETDSHHGHH